MQLRSLVGVFAVACGGAANTASTPPPITQVPTPTPTPAPVSAASARCTSTPREIASRQPGPAFIVVDGTNAYWTNQTGGQVMSAPLDGGEPRSLSEKQHPFTLAVDATHVYWANTMSRTGSVMRVPTQGGVAEVVAEAQGTPYGPALAAGGLYWVNEDEGSVIRAELDGGARKVLVSREGRPTALASDGRFVYWLDTKAGVDIRKVSVDGGPPVTLATEHGNPRSLVVDRSRVYWTNPHRGTVMAVPIDGGPMQELVLDEHHPIDLAVDATSVYWIDVDRSAPQRRGLGAPNRIRKAPLEGGNAVTLASGPDAVGIAIDAHCVYWTEARDTTGAVMAVAK